MTSNDEILQDSSKGGREANRQVNIPDPTDSALAESNAFYHTHPQQAIDQARKIPVRLVKAERSEPSLAILCGPFQDDLTHVIVMFNQEPHEPCYTSNLNLMRAFFLMGFNVIVATEDGINDATGKLSDAEISRAQEIAAKLLS